ncbi:hypothetical protein Droror1_Dr00015664 [Drosera rotundifolia]
MESNVRGGLVHCPYYPAHLNGQLPGDYGFHLAGLGKDPLSWQRYFNFEILHTRWAMLAAVGVVTPELLDAAGAFNFAERVWWRVGYSKLQARVHDLFPYLFWITVFLT